MVHLILSNGSPCATRQAVVGVLPSSCLSGLDGDGADHAPLGVALDRAPQRVLAGLDGHKDPAGGKAGGETEHLSGYLPGLMGTKILQGESVGGGTEHLKRVLAGLQARRSCGGKGARWAQISDRGGEEVGGGGGLISTSTLWGGSKGLTAIMGGGKGPDADGHHGGHGQPAATAHTHVHVVGP